MLEMTGFSGTLDLLFVGGGLLLFWTFLFWFIGLSLSSKRICLDGSLFCHLEVSMLFFLLFSFWVSWTL